MGGNSITKIGAAQVVEPAPREAWLSVLASDPDAMPSHSPHWIDAICDALLWRNASRLYITESGRRIVLPLTCMGIGAMARLCSPVCGWGYGGIIAEGGVQPSDIALVSADLSQRGKFSLWLRPNPMQSELWEAFAPKMRRVPKISHVVDLQGGMKAVRSRFGKSAIKGIKTAEKAGIRVETAEGGAMLPIYFELVAKSRVFWARRQNEPIWMAQLRGRIRDSEGKWRRIAKHMGRELQVSVAWLDERPAAVGIVVQARNGHGMRAAMDPELRNTGASHLLNLAVLQNASASQSRWFHLGESASPGAADFKESFGARPYAFNEFVFAQIPYWHIDEALRNLVKKAIGVKGNFPQEESGKELPHGGAK